MKAILAMLVVVCVPLFAQSASESNSASGDPTASATLKFSDSSGSNTIDINTGFNQWVTQNIGLQFSSLGLPVGAQLLDATLTLSIGASPAVSSSRSETDYQYTYTASCYSAYYNSYYQCTQTGTGYGGSASIGSGQEAYFTNVTDGTATAAIHAGSNDLLAMGFGPSLLAGNTLSVSGLAGLALTDSIFSYGYDADTLYSVSGSDPFNASGTLTVDYRLPTAAPEPGSAILLLTGLVIAFSAFGRRANRSDAR